ncbi:anti-sigma factor [Sulfobacillus thermosulfidooxidans]|uniref:anti-sigma factor n=1 Tax=Sulfobacillus thermosulfidooxidans TaxID=28034 RepID=UPI0006B434BA|nr:anti-sigma factor [Sulfobacillus thermosulfidooxidans]
MLNHNDESWQEAIEKTFTGLADADTQNRVTRHLKECEACQTYWHQLATFDSEQAWNSVEPDFSGHETMREEFFDRIQDDLGTNHPVPSPVKSRRIIMPWALSTAAAVIIAALGWQSYFHTKERAQQLDALVQMMSSSEQIHLANVSAKASTVLLYVHGPKTLIWVKALPALKSGETYEGWWLVKGTPVPAGTFGTGPHFLPPKKPGASAFAITIEPQGGTEKPTTPILVAATLPTSPH